MGDRRGEDRELRREARGQRDAGEGQQEQGEDAGDHRVLLAQPGPLPDVRGLGVAVSHQRDNPEGRKGCLLYTSPSPRDRTRSRMPSSA